MSRFNADAWADAMTAHIAALTPDLLGEMTAEDYARDIIAIAATHDMPVGVIRRWRDDWHSAIDMWSITHEAERLPDYVKDLEPAERYRAWAYAIDPRDMLGPGVMTLPEPWADAEADFYDRILSIRSMLGDPGIRDMPIEIVVAAYHLDDKRSAEIRSHIERYAFRVADAGWRTHLLDRLEEHKRTGEKMAPIWVQLGPCRKK